MSYRCMRRLEGALLFPALVLIALTVFVMPLSATHETIDMTDGDLSDLITAINNNLGSENGGFILPDATGELGVVDCAHYENGYDIDNGYVFFDFLDGSGDVTTNVTLYAGWDIATTTENGGVIGDSDGDGNPDIASGTSPGAACGATDLTGVSAAEFYEVRIFDCEGGILARWGVSGATADPGGPHADVVNLNTFLNIPGNFAISADAHQLKLRIPDILSLLPEGTDLCNMDVQLLSGSSLEILGEDQTDIVQLRVPPSVTVTKTPETQDICEGDPVSWVITITNDGLCDLDVVDVTDVLDAGLTYVSDDQGSSQGGNAQTRVWQFLDLAAGDQIVINLNAEVDSPCANPTLINTVDVEGTAGSCEGDLLALASAEATVNCLANPEVSVVCRGPESACDGETIELSATATNDGDGPADIEICIGTDCMLFVGVPSGESRTHTAQVVHECTDSPVTYTATATASNDCGEADATPDPCVVRCDVPTVSITKESRAQVQCGDTIQYTIVVTAGDIELRDLVITDDLCPEGLFVSAVPNAFSEPAPGDPNGTVVWNLAFLDSRESRTFTIFTTASLTPATCRNDVDVVGFCGRAEARDSAFSLTDIICGEDCPRTPGFWCQQEGDPVGPPGNGRRKFTTVQMNGIIDCIQDETDIFDSWSGIPDFVAQICGGGPGVRQAKRQFAAFMANVCAGPVGPAWNGNIVSLDQTTAVDCPPFAATNIGELIDEIDALLLSLEGGDPKDQAYQPIITCLDDINNGRTVDVGTCQVEDDLDDDLAGDRSRISDAGSQWGMGGIPQQYGLLPAFPNPVGASNATMIRFALPEASKVRLMVFDVAGRVVTTLVDDVLDAGFQEADLNINEHRMARGMYFYRMEAVGIESGKTFVQTQKMVVLQ